jgi:RND family efflux transporter MFP subunit
MKRIVQFLLIAVVVAGLAAGGYWIYLTQFAPRATAEDGTYTQVVAVEEGDLTASLSVVGQLEALQSAQLTFDQMGGTAKLQSLAVATGQKVTAGQVLATIDSAPYQQALDQARSQLRSAEENLADLQTPPTDLEFAQADMAVAEANLALERAKSDLADLNAPDLTSLEYAVQNAQDSLDLFELESSLADRDALAKSERDLTYSVDWYQRRIVELEQLVADDKANLEQTEEVAYYRNSLAQARADLATVQAERELARQSTAAELAQRRATLAEAQEALVDARAGGDELQQAQAQLAVREAEVALEVARSNRVELDQGPDATALAAAQAQVDKLRLAVSDAETALAGTELVAPFDGTILETHMSAGDAVAANSSIVTLADLGSLQVVASVDETTIRQVSAGQRASMSFDAYPNQTFEGEVLSVPLYGTLQGGVTVYDVPLSLSGAEALNLLVGMTANVEIEVGHVSDALLVPALALQKVSGSYQVSVPNTLDPAGEPETVPVQIGLSNGTYTQIVKGLIAGDQVIVQLDSSRSSASFFGGGNNGIFSGIFGIGRRR